MNTNFKIKLKGNEDNEENYFLDAFFLTEENDLKQMLENYLLEKFGKKYDLYFLSAPSINFKSFFAVEIGTILKTDYYDLMDLDDFVDKYEEYKKENNAIDIAYNKTCMVSHYLIFKD